MKPVLRVGGAVLLLMAALVIVGFLAYPLWVNDQIIRLGLWRNGVKSEYAQAGPYRLHYFEAGPAGGPPLVLVHGLGSRGEDWAPLIPGLAGAGFHVYVPDLPGYGRSPRPRVTYTIELEAKAVEDFMQTLHVDRAEVAGWSMGGWVAAKLTLEHPGMVDRLMLLDAAGVYFPFTFDASLFVPTDHAGMARLQAILSPEPQALPGFVERAAIRRLRKNERVLRSSVGAMLSGRDLLDFRMHRITQSTLIVWGKQDALIPLASGETMHREIANSSLFVVDGCGHLAPGECSGPVLKEMVGFLTAEPAWGRRETVEVAK
jgi:pimeloyl-ACP methyl ester carboxylesterase